jgi:hypothetical protein
MKVSLHGPAPPAVLHTPASVNALGTKKCRAHGGDILINRGRLQSKWVNEVHDISKEVVMSYRAHTG